MTVLRQKAASQPPSLDKCNGFGVRVRWTLRLGSGGRPDWETGREGRPSGKKNPPVVSSKTTGGAGKGTRRRSTHNAPETCYFAKRSKMSTSSDSRFVFSGSPLVMPSGTHFST